MQPDAGRLDTREKRLAVAAAIQRHLDAHGLARKDLIRDYLSKSTIDKLFQGEFSERTLTKIEAILKSSFAMKGSDDDQAPASLGGYSLRSVENLRGDYLYVRPMFTGSPNLNAYLMRIDLNQSERCLTFEERSRPDEKYAQKGVIYIPFGIPFLNLVSAEAGSLRSIQVSLPDRDGICRGIVSTLSNPKGAIYIPVAAPVFMRRLRQGEVPEIGFITPDSASYESYLKELMVVAADDYGVFVAPPQSPSDRRRTIAVVKP